MKVGTPDITTAANGALCYDGTAMGGFPFFLIDFAPISLSIPGCEATDPVEIIKKKNTPKTLLPTSSAPSLFLYRPSLLKGCFGEGVYE
jgi:hypothetical protein